MTEYLGAHRAVRACVHPSPRSLVLARWHDALGPWGGQNLDCGHPFLLGPVRIQIYACCFVESTIPKSGGVQGGRASPPCLSTLRCLGHHPRISFFAGVLSLGEGERGRPSHSEGHLDGRHCCRALGGGACYVDARASAPQNVTSTDSTSSAWQRRYPLGRIQMPPHP